MAIFLSPGRAIILLGTCTYIVHGTLIVKWDLDSKKPMIGNATRRVRVLIEQLKSEGAL